METHDLKYFIGFFEAIHEDKWTTGLFTSKDNVSCALGHLGVRTNFKSDDFYVFTEDSRRLIKIVCEKLKISFSKATDLIISFNDNDSACKNHSLYKNCTAETAKQRILYLLNSLNETV